MRAVIIGDEVDELSVGRKAGDGYHPIESKSEDLGFAAGGGSDGKMFGGVVEEAGIELGDVGDPLAVGGPAGGAIGAWIRADLREMRALVGVAGGDDPDVLVVRGVGVWHRAIAAEGKPLAIGRPGGLGVVEISGGDLG